ncbi:MAG: MarR family transcriptional regulator [Sandaracinaceae bacterium]|nr:MAG: MarR family transcriptional regulator [Sandaracinaceae bacterium]
MAEYFDIDPGPASFEGSFDGAFEGLRTRMPPARQKTAMVRVMGATVEERILRSLRRISRAIELHSKQLKATHRLTAPQLICLRELRVVPHTTPSELARAVSLSQATITGILDRLESRGFIQRARNPRDKRRVMVELTEEGRAAVDAAPLPLHHSFATRLGKLSEEEQAQIENVLARIVRMMEAEDIDAAPMLVGGAMSDDADEGRTGRAKKP